MHSAVMYIASIEESYCSGLGIASGWLILLLQVDSHRFAARIFKRLYIPDGVHEHYVGYWLIFAMDCKRLRASGAWGARARARP